MVQAEYARPADSFVDSIGVNTHFHLWTPNFAPGLKSKLGEIGIRYIRDNGATDATMSELYSSYGIKTLLVFDGGGTIASRVNSLGYDYMIGLQGRNEPDNFNALTFEGLTDDREHRVFSATRAYQYALYKAAKDSASAKLKPIVSPSMGEDKNNGTLSPLPFDKIGLHPYPSGEKPGWWRLNMECIPGAANMVAAGQSPQGLWATETGYATAYTSVASAPGGAVTFNAQAKYIPRLLATNFNEKIERTFLYEFMDGSQWALDFAANYGLIRNVNVYNMEKKPAYYAVKNLIALLKDNAPGGPAYIPGALNYTITPNPANPNIKSTLLRKRDGDYYLLLWQEVVSCTPGVAPSTPPADNDDVQAATVNVSFGVTATSVTKYTGLSGTGLPVGVPLGNNLSSITNLSVPDEIIILKITPPVTPPPQTGIPDPVPGPDLVITKVWSDPAEPKVGQATTLHATIKNRGTATTGVQTTVAFMRDGSPNPAFTPLTVPVLAAGSSVDIEKIGAFTPTSADKGFHFYRVICDYSSLVNETYAGKGQYNNINIYTLPVLDDLFTSDCASFNGWASYSPNWVVQSGGNPLRNFFVNTNISAAGQIKRTLNPAVASNWRIDFEYNWLYGAGAIDLSVYADMWDNDVAKNGYRIIVHQGDSNDPAYTAGQVELRRVIGGVAQWPPIASGVGYDDNGDDTHNNFKKVTFIYDRATQSVSAYLDLNGDGVLEQVIAPVRDTAPPATSFTQLVLGASDAQNANARPKFDNVRFSSGMLKLVPAPYFVDSFSPPDDLSQWPTVGNWTLVNYAGQQYVSNPTSGAPSVMTHPFVAPLTSGWSLGFDYDFHWGGNGAATNKYGFPGLKVIASMLDASNNGYRIVVAQGDGGVASDNNKIIKIYKVAAGVGTPIAQAEGVGYNAPGWQSLSKNAPVFKRVILTYNRKMQTLSAFIDLNNDGVMEQVIAPVQDISYTSFTQLHMGAACDASGSGATPLFDNIEVGLIQ